MYVNLARERAPGADDIMSSMSSASPPESPQPPDWFERRDLAGPSLRLTPLELGDAADYLTALGDSDAAGQVTAYLSHGVPESEAAVRDIIIQALATPDRLAYAQRLASTGELVGTTSFYEIDPALRSLGIGHTWIARRFWRTGVNTESKLVMLSRAFDELGAERVVWHTDIRNERSQAAIERLGATREGVLRHHRIRSDGSWRDTVQYSMLLQEWPAAQRRLQGALDSRAAQLELTHNQAASRYEGRLAGRLAGVVDYHLRGDTVVITHTGTEADLRGRGIAASMTRFALDDIRSRGGRVAPVCPYTDAFVTQHPEFADLLV